MVRRLFLFFVLVPLTGFAQTVRMNFPQIAVGDEYVTILTLYNPGTHTFNGSLGIVDDLGYYLFVNVNGVPFTNNYPLSVAAGNLISLRLTRSGTTVAGHAVVWDMEASPQVRDYEAQITGNVVFQFRQRGLLLDSIGVSPGAIIQRGILNAESTDTVFTGLALSEPFGQQATVTIRALATSGQPFTSTIINLGPYNHQAFFVHERLSIPPTGFKGIVEIESSERVGVTALRLEGSQLSTLPVMPRCNTYDFTIMAGRAYQGELLLDVGGSDFWGLIRWTNPPQDSPYGTESSGLAGMVANNGNMIAMTPLSMSGGMIEANLVILPPSQSADSLTGIALWRPSDGSIIFGTFSATRRR